MDIMFILAVVVVVCVVAYLVSNKKGGGAGQASSSTQGGKSYTNREKTIEGIKETQTSRVADQVSILEELEVMNPSYRQFCELTGKTMSEGGVVAPYSKRKVAYYDLRCYRIEASGNETLIAHEHSFDPFSFTDASSETPVYVDVESFGANVMLVNAANRVEGPTSEFANALRGHTSSTTSSGSAGVTAIVGRARECVRDAVGGAVAGVCVTLRGAVGVGLGWLLCGGRDVLAAGRRAVADAADALTGPAMVPAGAPAGGAGAGGAGFGATGARGNVVLMAPGPGGPGGRPGGGPGGRPGGHSGGGPGMRPGGGGPMSPGLGDFLGGPPRGYRRRDYGVDAGSVLVGVTLASLLGSLSTTGGGSQQGAQSSGPKGYRIVEDIVPLSYPVYCIGELYRNGGDVYMGAATSQADLASFFATKPESEVLRELGDA